MNLDEFKALFREGTGYALTAAGVFVAFLGVREWEIRLLWR